MPSTVIGETVGDTTVRYAFSDVASGNVSLEIGVPDPTARVGLAAAVGADVADLVFMQQVHGGDVAVVDESDRGRGVRTPDDGVPAVDALVTSAPGVALVVQVADCVPVLLAHPDHAVAAVHAGRGGVMANVVAAAVTALAPDGAAGVQALIGPAIGGCCYEVEAQLADEVAAGVPSARATTTWGTASLDLPAAVAAQLADAGVTDVTRVGACTRCTPERWFSHRREPGAGRQAGVVVRGWRHA